jgi:hypothetical protein
VDGHHGDGGGGMQLCTRSCVFASCKELSACGIERVNKADGALHGARTHWHTGWRTRTTIAPCDQSLAKLVKICVLLLHPVATQGFCNPVLRMGQL